MKYIISENRLHDFMTSYLDRMVESNLIMRHDPYLYIERPNYEDGDLDNIFQYMEYDRTDGRLWINKWFLNTFSQLFPLDLEQSGEFIKTWFENRFDVKINFIE